MLNQSKNHDSRELSSLQMDLLMVCEKKRLQQPQAFLKLIHRESGLQSIRTFLLTQVTLGILMTISD